MEPGSRSRTAGTSLTPPGLEPTTRLRAEIAFHDAQAEQRRRFFAAHPEALGVEDDAYLNHETWVRLAFDLLGEVRGHRILDYGCGHGMASVVLARRGAEVVAFDLSGGYVAEAQRRAEANGVASHIAFVQAAAERLPFRDGSFEGVWGNAVLHHLELEPAAAELARVLKPGGRAVFCEPWGENPLLAWARHRWRDLGTERSRDERPLRRRDLTCLRQRFREVRLYPQQLLAMAGRLWPALPGRQLLERWDQALLNRWPSLGRFCRYMVLFLRS